MKEIINEQGEKEWIIDKNWKINTDNYNVILMQKKTTKPTEKNPDIEVKDYWTPEGYYPSFKMALDRLIDKNCRDLDSLKDVVEKIDEVKAMIKKIKEVPQFKIKGEE